jgi:CHAD domain-containing protein
MASETGDVTPPPPHDEKPSWRKGRLPELAATTTAEAALSQIVIGCTEHIRGNEACVLGRAHEEGVHQMRVAVRRLRSCLSLYQDYIPSEQRDYLNGELKWLIGELGPARDWDVFCSDILTPVLRTLEDGPRLKTLREHVARHQDDAYARAQAAVGSQRYYGLVLLLGSWAEGRSWDAGEPADRPADMQSSVSRIAHDLLQQIHSQLLAAGENFATLDAEQRHKVRIHIKKLRYASEFFSTLFLKRRVDPFIAAMKTLQDHLGSRNDVEVAKKLLKRVLKRVRGKERAQLAYAAGLVVGWHSHVGGGREQELLRDWDRFVARRPYWQLGASPASAVPAREPDKEIAEAPEGSGSENDTKAGAEPESGPQIPARRRSPAVRTIRRR